MFGESVAVRRLTDATKIFTGRDVLGTTFERSALCVAGICMFLVILIEMSDDPAARAVQSDTRKNRNGG